MTVKTDICYSQTPHARSYLDICLPDGPVEGIFIHYHGGGLVSGKKYVTNSPWKEHLAEQGIAVVCPNYRLYPNAKYPEFIEDAAETAAWVYNHPEEFGGCRRIFVGGTSAGGYLAMMLYFDDHYLGKYGLSCRDFTGFVFDAGQPTTHFKVLAERGLNEKRVIIDEAAPIYHIDTYSGQPKMLIFVADNDISNRYEQTQLLRSTLRDFEYPAELISYHLFENCRHTSYLKTQPLEVGKLLVEFMK